MTIDDRLTAPSGTFFFSGLSMLVRLPLEQARRDRERGVASGTLMKFWPQSKISCSRNVLLERPSCRMGTLDAE